MAPRQKALIDPPVEAPDGGRRLVADRAMRLIAAEPEQGLALPFRRSPRLGSKLIEARSPPSATSWR